MSVTGRPSRPPLALTSSSQIFIATIDILPLGASGPVAAMPKPILIGAPEGAWAPAEVEKRAARAAAKTEATKLRQLRGVSMVSPHMRRHSGSRPEGREPLRGAPE